MNVLVDTGVWYAFCDLRERIDERESVDELLESLDFAQVLLPWPVVYETIRTRLSRYKPALRRLEIFLGRPNLRFVDDGPYREDALQLVFDTSLRKNPPRPLSMVDCLLRIMLDDVRLKIDRFATYNDGDFGDVCRNRMIEMVR